MKTCIRVTMALGLVLGIATSVMAQPGGRGQGRGGQGGRGGFGGGSRGGLTLLQDENVKKDLGINEDQVKKLAEFQAKSREEMRQAFQGLRDLSAEERTAKFQELQKKMTEMNAAAEKEILLPQQIERLKQISLQLRLRRTEVLRSDDMVKELGITEAQKEALQKAQTDAEAELQDKTAKLREESRQKVLSVLTPDQQAKLKSLIGEPIQFSRGRGGPGAPGGRGAGGRGAGGRPGGAPQN